LEGGTGLVEQILPNIYRIVVPLPRNPLKAVNSYVIKGENRNLIVDTAMNRPECLEPLQRGLAELAIDMQRTDLFITHMHADHAGLVADLATPESRCFIGHSDADIINEGGDWEEWAAYAVQNGFPAEFVEGAIRNHPGYKYATREPVDFIIVSEGQELVVGDYRFTCLYTPGHTDGHVCLYEKERRWLLSGDHLLRDITSNISVFEEEKNPLQDYLTSLDRVGELDVQLVLPGHRRVFQDYRERIQELQAHHQERAGEVYALLGQGDLDACQIAAGMTWDMSYGWDNFPLQQRWFAVGEALAHLRYLEVQGRVGRRSVADRTVYTRR
jgi:glyoxylase-like metal-dependent hydrolase (beta-lactamase superfamily II)